MYIYQKLKQFRTAAKNQQHSHKRCVMISKKNFWNVHGKESVKSLLSALSGEQFLKRTAEGAVPTTNPLRVWVEISQMCD